jgi:branched-chain amino acid transport system substrate-binding protein
MATRQVSSWTVIATLVVALLAWGFGPPQAPGQDVGEIKMGAFAPITGISADVGAQIKAGIEVAVERANQQGIRLGGKPYRVRLLWYDTEGKGDVGLNVVTRALTLDKIHIGVGFLSSDVFLRVMDEFQKAKVPIVDACAAAWRIGDRIAQNRMTHVFQLSPTTRDMVLGVSAAVNAAVKPQKIALLNENTDGGRDFSRFTRDWFAANAKQVEVVADEFVDRGITDLTPQLTKIKRAGPQAIITEIYGSSAPVLYNQWFELRVPAVTAHMGATVSAQDFIDRHQKVMEGHIVNNRWWPARYSDLSEPMMAAYKKKTGVDATNFAVQGHDSAHVAIDAMVRAGSLDADKVVAILEGGTFVTAWGTRKFAPLEEGHRMPVEMVVIQVQGGKKVPIHPPHVVAATGGKYAPMPPFAWEKK